MATTVHIHKSHRRFTDDNESVVVEGATVGECLKNLVRRYPAMQDAVFDAKGSLKNTIEIYLNMESAYPDELKKPVRDGDDIHVLLMLAGG